VLRFSALCSFAAIFAIISHSLKVQTSDMDAKVDQIHEELN
jgi:hypothetical protein